MNRNTSADIRALAQCRLFVFDLDGTLYAETSHFAYYGEQIAQRLPPDAVDAFRVDIERALALAHPLRYGRVYDVQRRLVRDEGESFDWSGVRVAAEPPSPEDVLIHVHDPWWVYGALAAHHGLDPSLTHEAFMATRAYMQGDDFPMTPMPGLRRALERLRAVGCQFVLATNSPEPDSRAILDKLELAGLFADCLFLARKPKQIEDQFANWIARFGVSAAQTVSIGDNYRNEIAPAVRQGMKTVYIDRYLGQDQPDVTVQLQCPDQLGSLFGEVAELAEGQQ